MKKITEELLKNLTDALEQINNEDYSKNLPALLNTSIGKHTRHIISFLQCLVNADFELSYDNRKRDELIETNKEVAINEINLLIYNIQTLDLSRTVLLKQTFTQDNSQIKTSYERELLFNIDHMIHHMAMIRIGIELSFPDMILPKHFGYNFSTTVYLNESLENK